MSPTMVEFEVRYDGTERLVVELPVLSSVAATRRRVFWTIAASPDYPELEKIEVRQFGTDEAWWNPSHDFVTS